MNYIYHTPLQFDGNCYTLDIPGVQNGDVDEVVGRELTKTHPLGE